MNEKHSLWWRAIAYLPEGPLFIECATCLFWRGAAVGALGMSVLVLLTTLAF